MFNKKKPKILNAKTLEFELKIQKKVSVMFRDIVMDAIEFIEENQK